MPDNTDEPVRNVPDPGSAKPEVMPYTVMGTSTDLAELGEFLIRVSKDPSLMPAIIMPPKPTRVYKTPVPKVSPQHLASRPPKKRATVTPPTGEP